MKAVRKLQDEYNKQACIKQKSFQEVSIYKQKFIIIIIILLKLNILFCY